VTVLSWLIAFALTQAIELPIHARALRHRERRVAWAAAFMASALTHPFVYLSYPTLASKLGWAPGLVIVESFAVLVEAAWLRRLGVRDALLWSLVANAGSVAVASCLRLLVG
jgi:acid phosphatase family membrane protein YuiD